MLSVFAAGVVLGAGVSTAVLVTGLRVYARRDRHREYMAGLRDAEVLEHTDVLPVLLQLHAQDEAFIFKAALPTGGEVRVAARSLADLLPQITKLKEVHEDMREPSIFIPFVRDNRWITISSGG